MKKISKSLVFWLTAVVITSVFLIRQPVSAALRDHARDPEVPLRYTNDTGDEAAITTLARCEICREWYVYCGPEDHSFVQKDVAYTTCTTDGYYTLECSYCGASFTHITDRATGHQWNEWTVSRQPTCATEGEQVRTCQECYESETQAIPRTEHSWGEWVPGKAPTCTADGERIRTCSVCGQTETQGTPATGHKWGEWVQTKAPSALEPGEEKRECSVCHEIETRNVDATGIYAKEGDTCFDVFIAKQLLSSFGKYEGDIDWVFDDILANSLRTFQKEKNFQESGELTIETMQALVEDFAGDFGEDIPLTGRLMDFESGLLVYPVFDSSYVSRGDGMHVRTSVFTGIRFTKNGEERSFMLPESKYVKLDAVHEGCYVFNEERTCPCGYHDGLAIVIADIAYLFKNGYTVSTRDLGIGESGLYIMLDIIYDEEGGYVYWDAVPGAVRYDIEISTEKDGEWETYKKLTTDTTLFPVGGMPGGSYGVCIQAFDENGEAVSEESYGSFDLKPDGSLIPPQFATLGFCTVSWADMNGLDSIAFRVQISAYAPGNKEIWRADKVTTEKYADFTKELASQSDFPAGTVLKAQVMATDPGKKYKDSSFSQTNDAAWVKPFYYRAEKAVNIRSGAGKEFERIGGLSKGDIVPCYGTENGTDGATYLKIGYQGRLAYVNAAFLTYIQPVRYSVKVDLGNGRSIDVATNPDGTIDIFDFEEQVSLRKNGRVGFRLEGFYLDGNRWDIADPVPEGTTLKTQWVEDSGCIRIELHYYNGQIEKVFIPIGENYPELKQEKNHIWTAGRNAQGSVFTAATIFTKDMDGMKLYESKLQETEIVLGSYASHCPDIFRQLYSEGAYPGSSLGTLEAGDRLRIEGSEAGTPEKVEVSGGQITISNEWIKVYSYRFEKTGHILAELLKNTSPSYREVYFDPNGGRMDVKSLKVRFDSGKDGYYIGVFPDAKKDNNALVGWADESGKIMTPQTEIPKDGITLTAVWTDEMPYASKTGVLYSSGHSEVDYYDEPSGKSAGTLPVASEVVIIRENEDKYFCIAGGKTVWISQDDVCTEYNKLYINATTEYYKDHTLNIMGKKPNGVLYKGEVGYQLEAGLVAYGVLMPPYQDKRSEPMYVWISKRKATQLITLYFDPSPGTCSYRAVQLKPISYLDYHRPSAFIYVRDKGGEIEMLPNARSAGYTFKGWYTDPLGGERVVVGERIPHDMTVYAHYGGLYDGRIIVVKEDKEVLKQGAAGSKRITRKFDAGTAGVFQQVSERTGEYLISISGETFLFPPEAIIWGEIMSAKPTGSDKLDWNVRSEPKTKAKSYQTVERGETFIVVEDLGLWYKIAYPESKNGFAYVRNDIMLESD